MIPVAEQEGPKHYLYRPKCQHDPRDESLSLCFLFVPFPNELIEMGLGRWGFRRIEPIDDEDWIDPDAEEPPPCWNTIPGGGFADVSFCRQPKGHEGRCW